MSALPVTIQSFQQHYSRYLATTLGRDKLLRLVQYVCQLWSWSLARSSKNPTSWRLVMKQLSLARKLLRLGKTVDFFSAAVESSRNQSRLTIPRYVDCGRYLALACYATLDAATLPGSMGLFMTKRDKLIQREATRYWCIAVICSLTMQMYTLCSFHTEQILISSDDSTKCQEEKEIRDKKYLMAREQTLSDVCDLTISLSSLGYMKSNDGFVGICGVVSSLISVSRQWKAI